MNEPVTIEARDREAWDELAVRVYGPGQERQMAALLTANPTLTTLAILPGGTTIVLPQLKTAPASSALPPWKR